MDQSFLEGNKHNAGKSQEPWDTLVTLAAYPRFCLPSTSLILPLTPSKINSPRFCKSINIILRGIRISYNKYLVLVIHLIIMLPLKI
jgi:hypothetical protein